MIELNLTANNKQEELIKAYLQENVTQALADKINNGTPFSKDGKPLINKKSLSGFMKYACDEAKKLAEKGATSACIDSDTVFGWAVHYFEEKEIEGTLYTIDGEEYKPAPKVTKPVSKPVIKKPEPEEKQFSIFDMANETKETDDELPSQEEIDEIMTEIAEEEQKTEEPPALVKPKGNSLYQQYTEIQSKYPGYVVAYRLGDFYEVFGQNAVNVSNELGLTLTGRDCGLESRVPMVGFPYHVSDIYISKLVQKGFKVAVAETVSDIKSYSDERIVDEDTGEILSEEEMREFDGDIEEPSDLLAEEQELASHYDTDVIRDLMDILRNTFIVG